MLDGLVAATREKDPGDATLSNMDAIASSDEIESA